MKDIKVLIERVPDDLKLHIDDFAVARSSGGQSYWRVVLDCLLSEDESEKLRKIRGVAFVGTCHYRYAPEIKKTYFYIR